MLFRSEDGEVRGFSPFPDGSTENVDADHPDLVEFLKEKPHIPAVANPMARLLIRKGLITAREVNDEFSLGSGVADPPGPPEPPEPPGAP